MKQATILWILLSCLITGIHCSKDKSNIQPATTCKMVTITEGSGASNNAINLKYNNEGKISEMNDQYSNSILTYTGNEYVYTTYRDGVVQRRVKATVNGMGLLASFNEKKYDISNGKVKDSATASYEYNSKGELLKEIRKANNDPEQTSVASWSNGNCVTLGNSHIEYYTDKPAQPGDYASTIHLVGYAAVILKNKNLMKSIATSTYILNFNYEFDEKGNISKLYSTNSNSGLVTTYAYQYSCE